MAASLAGCRVVITRERPGLLAELLSDRGADVRHVPLIEVVDPDDGGRALRTVLRRPDRVDWVLVTSPAGAERVAAGLVRTPDTLRFGAVGTATAERLAQLIGRSPELTPHRQLAAELAERFVALHAGAPQRVVVAQADRANAVLVDELRRAGHVVDAVVAYRTVARVPSDAEIAALVAADAVVFASGSAASSWSEALGDRASRLLPPIVVAIGPTTAAAAAENGLKVTAVAADHSVPGLVAAVEHQWRTSEGSDRQ
ncbi:MAG: uroporphyrinogen-III synthase [Actinomycetota bacterium]